jgi:hypothetical protein
MAQQKNAIGVAVLGIMGDDDPKFGSFGGDYLREVEDRHRRAQIAYLTALGKGPRVGCNGDAAEKRAALVAAQKELSFARRGF